MTTSDETSPPSKNPGGGYDEGKRGISHEQDDGVAVVVTDKKRTDAPSDTFQYPTRTIRHNDLAPNPTKNITIKYSSRSVVSYN